MAKPSARTEKRPRRRSKARDGGDEEISEDGAFNDEDEARYGRFFHSKQPKEIEETGELWDCLFEGAPGGDSPAAKDSSGETAKGKRGAKPTKASKADKGTKAVKPTKRAKTEKGAASDDHTEAFDRLEEDEDLFTEDFADDGVGGFKWITDADDHDPKYAALVSKFKAIAEDLPDVYKEESRAAASRDERRALYESVKKEVTKRWEPVLKHMRRKRHIEFGGDDERSDPTCGSITQMMAETPLEKELESQVNVAYERALHARELRKQKRVNRIKSKNWHKRQKKRDLELYAKLIEKSTDPDLTKELLESFEQKRSKHRILRKRMAQEKWAKLAMRFGDRNVLKHISTENQKLRDDLAFIKHTIDGAKGDDGSGSDGESDDSTDDSGDDSGDAGARDDVLEKLKIIANPRSEPMPQRGLFALKFMKDAMQSKRDGGVSNGGVSTDVEEENDTSERLGGRRTLLDDYDEDYCPSESESDGEDAGAVEAGHGKPMLPAVSEYELKLAMQQIQLALGGQVDGGSADATASEVPAHTNGLDADVKKELGVTAGSSSRPSVKEEKPRPEPRRSPRFKTEGAAKPHATTKPVVAAAAAVPALLDEDAGLHNFIKNLGPAKKRNETVEMAKRLFVTRPDEENYLSADEEDEEGEEASDGLKGWGSWTGFGLLQAKKKPAEQEPKAAAAPKKRPRVKISNKKDTKVAKYLLHRVPHPYKNKHDYNAKVAISVGPEWNTSKMHAQLVQPKTTIKVGSVVKALSAEGAKDYVKRMGKALSRNRTRARL